MHTITLPEQYQPWLCASPDDTRPVLAGVWFDPSGVCVATDTVVLCVCPCTVPEGFPGALVPAKWLAEVWRKRLKGCALTLQIDPEKQSVSALTKAGTMSERLLQGQFPNFRCVIDKEIHAEQAPKELLGFHLPKLLTLQKAIGVEDPACALGAGREDKNDWGACLLLPGFDGAFGVLMPINPNRTREEFHQRRAAAETLWRQVQDGTRAGNAPASVPAAPKAEKVKMKPVLGSREKAPRKAETAPVPVPVAPEPEPAPVPEPVPVPVPAAPARPLPAWLASVL